MKSRDVASRLTAYAEGRPVPAGSTITIPIAEPQDRMLLSLVRMGGESLPWAIAYQVGESDPVFLSVPDGRQRDPVGDMCAEFAEVICGFLGSPILTGEVVDPENPPKLSLRQVWVPNRSHLEMLHLLNLRYARTTYRSDERARTLRALGRACGFLFRESERAGQKTVIDASAALRDHFVFPVDDIRQQHLGFLLAMLRTDGDLAARMSAAEEAEELAVSHTLDPELERDELSSLVTAFQEASRNGTSSAEAQAAEAVTVVLDNENRRRLDLVREAIGVLFADGRSENRLAGDLGEDSVKERDHHYRWSENKGSQDGDVPVHMTTSAVTDNRPTSASKRYYRMLASDDKAAVWLLHDDEELQKVAIAAGDAIEGTVAAVLREPSRRSGREVEVWRIEASASVPSRVRQGGKLCVAGSPGLDCLVVEVEVEADKRVIVIEPDQKLARSLAEGEGVVFLPATANGISFRKSEKAAESDGPGAWLTHGESGRPRRRQLRGADVLERVKGLRGS